MHKMVTVVSKRGCHLCEKVVEALNSLSSKYDLEVTVLDINDDFRLHDKYFFTIPAVLIDGKDAFDARHIGGEAGYAIMLDLDLGPLRVLWRDRRGRSLGD
jgi:glutaredoxin